MILETRGSGGSTSTAPKPSTEDPTSIADPDARSAKEMADSMLRDSPLPDVEEEGERRQEEILTG